MAGAAAPGSGVFKFIKPNLRFQASDIQSAALWGVTGATGALWLIQPFDWLKKTFLEKPAPEEK